MLEPTPTPPPEGSETQSDDKKTSEGQQPADDPPAEPKADDKPKTFTQDEVNRLLAKEKRDAEARTKAAEAKAKLSEDERTKAELAEARSQLAERDRRDAVKEASEKAGVNNPSLLYKAIKDDLEIDEKTGQIKNLTEVMEAAKADFPQLFTPKSQGSADGGSGKGKQSTLTKEEVEKMSPKEIEDRWEEVSTFLTSQK